MAVDTELLENVLESYFTLPGGEWTIPQLINSGFSAIVGQLDEIIALLDARLPKAEQEKEKEKEVIPESSLSIRLLDAIKKTPGIKRTDLIQAMDSRKRSEVPEALNSLEAMSLAYRGKCQGAGRPAECWYPRQKQESSKVTIAR